MRVLATGLEPEDILMGCAGTTLDLYDEHHEIFLLLGHSGLKIDQKLHADLIGGVRPLSSRTEHPTAYQRREAWIHSAEKAIDSLKPHLILLPYSRDIFAERQLFSQSLLSAARRFPNLIFYELPSSQQFTPNLFVEIKKHIAEKLDFLKTASFKKREVLHQKTLGIEGEELLDWVRSIARLRGLEAGIDQGEGFVPYRVILGH